LLIPRCFLGTTHGATKGIQIAELEKVTALVRGVENLEAATTKDTKVHEGKQDRRVCRILQAWGSISLHGAGGARLFTYFLLGTIDFISGVGYANCTFSVRPWNDEWRNSYAMDSTCF
jgi:hypothetical protein